MNKATAMLWGATVAELLEAMADNWDELPDPVKLAANDVREIIEDLAREEGILT